MDQKPLLSRVMRGALVLLTTCAFIVGAFFVVKAGSSALATRAASSPPPDSAPLVPVSVRALDIEQGFLVPRQFVGQVEPRKTVALSFELSGRVDTLNVDEGDIVSAGQLIAAQDTDRLEADRERQLASRAAVEAQLAFAVQTLERSETLRDRGFASQERLDQAQATRDELNARINEIMAAVDVIDIQLNKSELYAPFDGRVTRRLLDGGEAVGPGQTVLEIVETGVPQIRVGVPLTVPESALTNVTVALNGQTYDASLASFRPDIDPVTRTRTAIYNIETREGLAFGQTAGLVLETYVETSGSWVPVRSLKEGARGQWTLLVVDENDIVRRADVLVVHSDGDMAYVQGSFPAGTRMIEEGPQRVTVGQAVQVQQNE